jgi:16S rRNA (cytosine1402-N4)-methyltransferase
MKGEVLEYLAPAGEKALFVDCTLGEGGHSEAILDTWPGARVIGIDTDAGIQARARERLARFGDRITFVNGWSDEVLAGWSFKEKPDRILIDAGISVYHYEVSGRGFSFDRDEPLDMRLSVDSAVSAADLVAGMTEGELADLIFYNSDERYSRRIAKAICETRRSTPIVTGAQLADLIKGAVPPPYRHGRIHPATRTFQALRMAVNGEIDHLSKASRAALELLPVGGRLAVISFHSHEDRLIKRLFRSLTDRFAGGDDDSGSDGAKTDGSDLYARGMRLNILTPRPVTASEAEIGINSPSRSAKLRVAEVIHA